ncbi:hypothetical protein LINGRAHAP2_LOCUS32334, partial [Linum grandiflorum]
MRDICRGRREWRFERLCSNLAGSNQTAVAESRTRRVGSNRRFESICSNPSVGQFGRSPGTGDGRRPRKMELVAERKLKKMENFHWDPLKVSVA